ncbi:MAG: GNAT family N-acetyltransferase [Planctomycetota bacterium]
MPHPESQRLAFEPIREALAEQAASALCDPAVYEFIDEAHLDLASLQRQFRNRERNAPPEDSDVIWIDRLARLRDTQAIVGRVEATVRENRAEVAYLFGSAHWGQGLASESLAWLHDYLKNDHAVVTFWATVHPDNRRSIRLLERNSYTPTPPDRWPKLFSYDPGDLVFSRSA